MSQVAVDHFCEGIQDLTERMKREYDLTLAEALGCLECVKHDLIMGALDYED